MIIITKSIPDPENIQKIKSIEKILLLLPLKKISLMEIFHSNKINKIFEKKKNKQINQI